eukprot:SAG11_NODE_25254_length_361_cov_0.988550_1_plen_120_part_11
MQFLSENLTVSKLLHPLNFHAPPETPAQPPRDKAAKDGASGPDPSPAQDALMSQLDKSTSEYLLLFYNNTGPAIPGRKRRGAVAFGEGIAFCFILVKDRNLLSAAEQRGISLPGPAWPAA